MKASRVYRSKRKNNFGSFQSQHSIKSDIVYMVGPASLLFSMYSYFLLLTVDGSGNMNKFWNFLKGKLTNEKTPVRIRSEWIYIRWRHEEADIDDGYYVYNGNPLSVISYVGS